MSLAEAITEIADQIDEDAESWTEVSFRRILYGYSRQLRSAVKASGGNQPTLNQAAIIAPEAQHFVEIQKARAEFRKSRDVVQEGERMTECRGGPMAGDHVTVPGEMPTGAKTAFGEWIYQLGEDGYLHYLEIEKEG